MPAAAPGVRGHPRVHTQGRLVSQLSRSMLRDLLVTLPVRNEALFQPELSQSPFPSDVSQHTRCLRTALRFFGVSLDLCCGLPSSVSNSGRQRPMSTKGTRLVVLRLIPRQGVYCSLSRAPPPFLLSRCSL